MFHSLDPLVRSDLELNYETLNPFKQFGISPWMGDRPNVMTLEFIFYKFDLRCHIK